MRRRDFLAAAGSAALLGCSRKAGAPLPPGELLGPDLALGHRLRSGDLPAPAETRRVGALVVGGGMAGLACGWWLRRGGFDDFALLELEAEAGGNARAGRNAVSAYPWGAHYLPLPGPEAREIRLMLAEFGLLRGDPLALRPEYDERHLCHSPQERLFIHGAWQEGLLPQFGISAAERAQQQRFIERMAGFKAARGADSRPAYAVPSARGGAPDPALDRISLRDWLLREGFTAPSLHWWANYGCRDDYGTDYAATSAWAGLHYHAGRHGEASNAEGDDVLTWPEGNAWLARRLAERVGERLVGGAMVWRIGGDERGVEVDVYLAAERRSVRYRAERLVWAGPAWLLPRLWPQRPAELAAAAAALDHAPWLVANLTLREPPDDAGPVPLSWDNVLYRGQGLGYVVATHQQLGLGRRGTVLTYYRPLSETGPAAGRRLLLETPRERWAAQILAELGQAHPDIAAQCERLDVWRWGHAMVRPRPGLLGGPALPVLRRPHGRILAAHADLSGFSLAEEAHYWGVRAARWLMDDAEWNA
ncbi:NAD(P)/FAD-dependent oxidoreductase [Chitinimonas koreensis]|uniref:NAD(P)-binding protein n=1 Tax=Chitinimonas koreensis TaxID=356302 RepID=UPI00041947A5|nr:NAD(P)/FAD-dependent oxidoreductase [Chitinimonas koreensis]QNM95989.1 NAD(P)-binding protein [Chitinimonas koreensis]